ncbi:hypothetical protein B0H16DRAFT_1566317 [Mycena metata]|uniref:Uncharacterized protein n=1 Tax=Mycena metata TaxID=1033252 RepID=A0AAD7N071_9AGAR|nr:hypothetical protein B0H16DRAFT_1566317 [Mycena metata]
MSTATTRPPFFCTADLLQVWLRISFPGYSVTIPALWTAVEELIEANPPLVAEENVMGFVSDDGWNCHSTSIPRPVKGQAHTKLLEHRDSKGLLLTIRGGRRVRALNSRAAVCAEGPHRQDIGADAPRKLSAIVVLTSLAHCLSHSCQWRCSSRAEWAVGAFCFLVCPVCFVVEKWEWMRGHRAADAPHALLTDGVGGCATIVCCF